MSAISLRPARIDPNYVGNTINLESKINKIAIFPRIIYLICIKSKILPSRFIRNIYMSLGGFMITMC